MRRRLQANGAALLAPPQDLTLAPQLPGPAGCIQHPFDRRFEGSQALHQRACTLIAQTLAG